MFLKKCFVGILICLSSCIYGQKTYQKNYYSNKTMKSEGWVENGQKTGYWKYYYKNGSIKKEGHYKNSTPVKYWYFYARNGLKEKEGHYAQGKKNKWWLFYDTEGNVNHKCQLKDNHKNGYCLIYRKNRIIKASKFQQGKKIKEWTDLSSFRKENKLRDLR